MPILNYSEILRRRRETATPNLAFLSPTPRTQLVTEQATKFTKLPAPPAERLSRQVEFHDQLSRSAKTVADQLTTNTVQTPFIRHEAIQATLRDLWLDDSQKQSGDNLLGASSIPQYGWNTKEWHLIQQAYHHTQRHDQSPKSTPIIKNLKNNRYVTAYRGKKLLETMDTPQKQQFYVELGVPPEKVKAIVQEPSLMPTDQANVLSAISAITRISLTDIGAITAGGYALTNPAFINFVEQHPGIAPASYLWYLGSLELTARSEAELLETTGICTNPLATLLYKTDTNFEKPQHDRALKSARIGIYTEGAVLEAPYLLGAIFAGGVIESGLPTTITATNTGAALVQSARWLIQTGISQGHKLFSHMAKQPHSET